MELNFCSGMSWLTNWLSLKSAQILALVPYPLLSFEAASLMRESRVTEAGLLVLSRKCSLTLLFLISFLHAGVTIDGLPSSSV